MSGVRRPGAGTVPYSRYPLGRAVRLAGLGRSERWLARPSDRLDSEGLDLDPRLSNPGPAVSLLIRLLEAGGERAHVLLVDRVPRHRDDQLVGLHPVAHVEPAAQLHVGLPIP